LSPAQEVGLSEEEARKLAFALLREWWLAATQALVDEAGPEDALKHLKPYFVNTGMAGAHNIQKILGITAQELLRRDVITSLWPLVTGGRQGGSFCADDGSWISEAVDCATGGSSREGCISLCEYTGTAYQGELAQGEEIVLTKALSFGDPVCQWVAKEKGREAKVAAVAEFRVPEDERPPPPEDDLREYLALSIIGEAWSNATRAFIDFAGPERALDRLHFYMRHAGLSFGIRMSERFEARERGVDSILDMIKLVQILHHRKSTYARREEDIEGEVSECPFSSSCPEMCAQYEAFFNGICEAVDPAYEFAYDRRMTHGDQTCHWVIRMKRENAPGPTDGKPGKKAIEDDPRKILSIRLAKGEIGEEEYRRLRQLLDE
jgi:hypothetical protein